MLLQEPALAESNPAEALPSELVRFVEQGLPLEKLEQLRRSLDLPMDRLAPRLGLSKATLHRRRIEGRLSPDESDKVVRFARLYAKARQIFGTEESARAWLNAGQLGLGGAVPLDFAQTEVGAREVEDLLTRIDFSVYA